ncbi:response regulator [Pararhodospirillum oryzae]|uniref:Response regulatory domain-containing protein n=1 Tax=Pararhodospirillum oryzae TaxID=478448 RepID=A0A512H3X8_9PROT|nr:response regulator [Pararhodospirillum oryzae]GEO80141.1 hypothetical protein ROR02_02720 [Pararhodospirillum oryzae]
MKQYSTVNAVLHDPDNGASPAAIVLQSLGVRSLRRARTPEALGECCADRLIDLVIFDHDAAPNNLVVWLRRLRTKRVGTNPFAIVIALASDTSPQTIRQLINAGVDHVVRKPFPTETLAATIQAYTQSRKPFSTSCTYVGPTRRAASRDLADARGLTHVPNTLRAKVVEEMDEGDLVRRVNQASAWLEDSLIEAHAARLVRLAGTLTRPDPAQAPEETLDEIATLVMELRRRIGQALSPQLDNLLGLLSSFIGRRDDRDALARDPRLVEKLTQAIERAVRVEKDSIELMGEIVHTIVSSDPCA